MPLTSYQKEIAGLLAAHRNPESYLAGGAVINRLDTSFRYSHDFDIFHDKKTSVAMSAESDAVVLREAGHFIEWTVRQEGFFRARVKRGDDGLDLDWTSDSAFRFFPIQTDDVFGCCLHRADLATNKVLALASRAEIRDLLDILYLDTTYLSLGAMVWAACGKDAGFTPSLLLNMANRHARFQESDLSAEVLARPFNLRELKVQWLDTRERAEILVQRLPEVELGCLYLDAANHPVSPDPAATVFSSLQRHMGSVRGAWPRIS